MVRRSLAGAALGAALVLSLTGCLGESGGTDLGGVRLAAAEAIQLASQKTKQVDTFKANVKLGVDAPGGESISLSGPAHYRVRPTYGFHMSFTEVKVPGVQMPDGGHLLLIGDTAYVKAPMVSQVFKGKQWVKLSIAEAGKSAGADFGGLVDQMRRVDPIANTQMLTASKDAREVGQETVDGVRTRHYQGTYSVEEALTKLDKGQRARLREELNGSGLDKMNFDLWVDGEQLPRKLVLKSNGAGQGTATVTVAYRDFGKRVNITAPPAGEVADLSELANRFGPRN